jgi:hypothetical protein
MDGFEMRSLVERTSCWCEGFAFGEYSGEGLEEMRGLVGDCALSRPPTEVFQRAQSTRSEKQSQ